MLLGFVKPHSPNDFDFSPFGSDTYAAYEIVIENYFKVRIYRYNDGLLQAKGARIIDVSVD